MNRLLELLKFILPYKGKAFLNIFFNILGVVFSLFQFTMVIPFLGMLFKTQELVYETIPLSLSIESLKQNFYYYLSKIIIEYGQASALLVISILVVVFALFRNGAKYMANFYIIPLRGSVIRDIRQKIYYKITELHLGYFSDSRKGDIMARISNDVMEVEWSILNSIEVIFREPITVICFLIALIVMSPELSLFTFALLPVSAGIIGWIGKSLREQSLKGQTIAGQILSNVEETLSGLRIIKAFNAERKVKQRFDATNNGFLKIFISMMRRRDLASPLSEFLTTIILMAILYYGGSTILNQTTNLQPDVFIGYLVLFSQLVPPIKAFSTASYNIRKGIASLDRINTILSAKNTITENSDPLEIKEFRNKIEFRNVSFKYGDEWVLKNINLTIEKGKTIALVGQSGSGKSTLVDLIPRFYDVIEGTILIDDIPINKLKIKDLRNLMGNVNQESILFNDTIYNNIAFGVDKTTPEAVQEAAMVANAHNFIIETPDSYNTSIGDRGNKLSGGQRQRLSIARAVLKNPPIMILDEATSSLDTESERLVQDALTHLMENRTSIVIAHRLSTIKHADEICVLHEGEIVERGKHEELLNIQGVYKKLHDIQMFS